MEGVAEGVRVPDTEPVCVPESDPDPVRVKDEVCVVVIVGVEVSYALGVLEAVLEEVAVNVVVEVLDQAVPVTDCVPDLEAVTV